MNDYLLAVILGIVEGVTEFLPVSSTAHLRLSEVLMGINLADGYWKMFAIVIQFGPILALPIYFWATIRDFVAHFPRGPRGDRTALTHPLTLIFVAFVCTSVPVLLLKKIIGKNLESIVVMGTALLVGGVIMWIVDVIASRSQDYKTKRIDEVSMPQAIWIGFCQVLAPLFPGTSRSMATIAAGQLSGMSRPVALEFSFLLSIPTMVAATGYDLLKAVMPGKSEGAAIVIGTHGAALLAIGALVAFVVAYIVIAWFMNWVRKHGFVPFAIYRIVVGAAVLMFSGRFSG